MFDTLVPSPECIKLNIFSCSLTCFKIHKESCQPKDQSENGKSTTEKEVSQKGENVSSSDPLPSTKVQKECAILSPGQLAILRTIRTCPKLTKAKLQMRSRRSTLLLWKHYSETSCPRYHVKPTWPTSQNKTPFPSRKPCRYYRKCEQRSQDQSRKSWKR